MNLLGTIVISDAAGLMDATYQVAASRVFHCLYFISILDLSTTAAHWINVVLTNIHRCSR